MHVPMDNEKSLIPISFLQSGNDLPITSSISFKHPTIKEVFDIDKNNLGLHSEDIYYSMINIFLTDPYTYMVYLDDKNIDYEKATDFDVFVLLFNDYINEFQKFYSSCSSEESQKMFMNNIFFKAFDFFLGIKSFFIVTNPDGSNLIVNGEKQVIMDSRTYDYVTEFVKKMNGIPDREKIYPEDEWAKKILIEDEREKLKKQSTKNRENENSNKDRLGNLISVATWACNGGVTPFNRNQLHMYDLIDGLHRTDKLLNYKNTMVGLYSGCVDKKKINFKELHWSN